MVGTTFYIRFTTTAEFPTSPKVLPSTTMLHNIYMASIERTEWHPWPTDNKPRVLLLSKNITC